MERSDAGGSRNQKRTMNEKLTTIRAEKIVDARGIPCPGPLLAAKKGIRAVSPGGIMEVQTTDPVTAKDLPVWAGRMGYEYLGMLEEPGQTRLFVRKTEQRRGA